MNQSNTKIHIKGHITSGKGKGEFFISQEQYRKQFLEKLGYLPYSGTLNILLKQDETRKFLQKIKGITIHGFQIEKKTFGKVKCIEGTIKKKEETQNINLLIPEKSDYTNIIEIIAPLNLRKKLELNDGDEIEVIIKM